MMLRNYIITTAAVSTQFYNGFSGAGAFFGPIFFEAMIQVLMTLFA
jgi:hypothetical protein